MPQRFRQSVAISLAICLLLLSGAIYAQTVPHTLHHAQHKAATHSTTLCTWLCAAGQVLDGGPVLLQASSTPLNIVVGAASTKPVSLDRPVILLRGPPTLFA